MPYHTQVETTNLAVHSHCQDIILQAECISSFPRVTFPATLLLRREEVETGAAPGASVIEAVHAGRSAVGRRAFKEPPFDLMYGFRGRGSGQGLLSPFEMLRGWSMEEVRPPTAAASIVRSRFTEQGEQYRESCRAPEAACRVYPRHTFRSCT